MTKIIIPSHPLPSNYYKGGELVLQSYLSKRHIPDLMPTVNKAYLVFLEGAILMPIFHVPNP